MDASTNQKTEHPRLASIRNAREQLCQIGKLRVTARRAPLEWQAVHTSSTCQQVKIVGVTRNDNDMIVDVCIHDQHALSASNLLTKQRDRWVSPDQIFYSVDDFCKEIEERAIKKILNQDRRLVRMLRQFSTQKESVIAAKQSAKKDAKRMGMQL
jgi:hypothetical protein